MHDAGSSVVHNERVFDASPQSLHACFEHPGRLARWWGPKGFTNTFQEFDFRPGGRWVFVMHGPNGANHHNENIFREIEPGRRIVIEHILEPWFRLTITMTPRGEHTHLAWDQEFESPEFAARMRAFCQAANEEVLDRLQVVLEHEAR